MDLTQSHATEENGDVKQCLNEHDLHEYIQNLIGSLKKSGFKIKKRHRFRLEIDRVKQVPTPLQNEIERIFMDTGQTPNYESIFYKKQGEMAVLYFKGLEELMCAKRLLKENLGYANDIRVPQLFTKLIVRNLPQHSWPIVFPSDGPVKKLLVRFKRRDGSPSNTGIVLVLNQYLDDLLACGYNLAGRHLLFSELEESELYIQICTRCYQYGHYRSQCGDGFRCRFCAGIHDSASCEKKGDMESYHCLHCGQNHSCLYRRCPVRRSIIGAFTQEHIKTSSRILKSVETMEKGSYLRMKKWYMSVKNDYAELDKKLNSFQQKLDGFHDAIIAYIEKSTDTPVQEIIKVLRTLFNRINAFERSQNVEWMMTHNYNFYQDLLKDCETLKRLVAKLT